MKRKIQLILIVLLNSFYVSAQDTILLTAFESGYIPFLVQNKIGLLNENKNVIIPANYDKIGDIRYNLIKVVQNDKLGFLNYKNQIIIPLIYEIDTNISIGARIYKQDEYGANGDISKTTIMIGVDENYTGFTEGLCAVIKNGKYGFIDTLGNVKIPIQFDGADNFFNGLAIVKKNNTYGAINKNGDIVIPFLYDLLVVENNVEIYAQKNGENFYINSEGKRLKE